MILRVDDAYALETPEDNVRLYKEWATSYDDDFVAKAHYMQYRYVADQLLLGKNEIDGPVLDVGCGTGVVGTCLRDGGIREVDGIDISQDMLDVAGQKTTAAGDPAYRNLIQADLTGTVELADDQYGGLISAGTFTHGHLGPDALDELWRVAAPGAQCAFTVRSTHYRGAGFADKLAADVVAGTISDPSMVEINVYAADAPDRDHANDTSIMVTCKVL